MSKDIHKWTDGRYTLMFDEHTFFVFDNEKEKRMTALQVTEKLNKQQDTIRKLRNENIISKNKIEDLRVSLFMLNKELERQIQRGLDE